MKLQNRTAFITGGGRGIGRAIAFAFAREGAKVAVVARTAAEVSRVAREVQDECGVQTFATECDVTSKESIERAFRSAVEHLKSEIDILVNNAGIAESALFIRTTDELWQRHLDTNLSGTFYCARVALPSMIESGWGRIINVASIAGKTGAPYIAAYAASKHGVLGLTRSLALEIADKGITVNAICPGWVDTDMTMRGIENITAKTGRSSEEALDAIKSMSPQNRLITPEEVAALSVLLASEEGRGITGQAINVDGGTVQF